MLSRRFNELPGKDKGPVNQVHKLITRLKGLSRRGLEGYRTIIELYGTIIELNGTIIELNGRFKKYNGWIER
jgi:hypothetical protein